MSKIHKRQNGMDGKGPRDGKLKRPPHSPRRPPRSSSSKSQKLEIPRRLRHIVNSKWEPSVGHEQRLDFRARVWISSTDNKTICSSQHSMCADNDIKRRPLFGAPSSERVLFVFIMHAAPMDVTKKGLVAPAGREAISQFLWQLIIKSYDCVWKVFWAGGMASARD